MFGKVFHFDITEVAHARMKGQLGKRGAQQFEAFHEDLAEVHACRGGGDGAFHLGIDRLEVVGIFG